MVAGKLMWPSEEILRIHYDDLSDKPFFPDLIQYMNSGPVFAMVWQGKSVVKVGRLIIGATNPLESSPGTIRGDYSVDVGRNLVHGSDSLESASKEISLWFGQDLLAYDMCNSSWVFE